MDSFGEVVTKRMTHSFEPNDIATKGTPSQIDESTAFTQAVIDKYPNSKVRGAGHSLGAYIAQYNAVKFNFESTTTYAAPNPYGAFSGDIKKQIDEGKYNGKIKNIGHDDDIVNGAGALCLLGLLIGTISNIMERDIKGISFNVLMIIVLAYIFYR